MKILMVGPYPSPGRAISGGVERVIDTLMLELRGQVDLTLVVPGAYEEAETFNHDVRTIYLKRGAGPGVLAYWTADAKRLAQAIAWEQPDLVHLQASAGVGRLISVPRILTIHGIAHRDMLLSVRGQRWGAIVRQGAAQLIKSIEAASRQGIGNIIVINPYVTESLPDVARMRLFPIPNPIDRRFCRASVYNSKRDKRMVAVGRIGPLKNILLIIQIGVRVISADPVASLVVCGAAVDSKYEQICHNLIRSRRLSERITMIGNVSTDGLIAQLDQSSVLLMASQHENAPMVIAEAHSRGVAVIAPKAFGIKHMITPSKNGFFLPDGSMEEQVRVIQMALDFDWDREAIAIEARATYDPRKVAELTLSAYKSVLSAV